MVKNIVLLNDYDYITGGSGQIAVTTANALAETGRRVIFLSAVSNPERSTLSPKVEKHSTQQYDILNNPSRIDALYKGLWNNKSAKLLRSILESIDPAETVIHIHSWIKALSSSVGKVIFDSGFPVVCTLHDFFTVCPNGGFYNYPRNEICYLKPMSLSCICSNCDVRSYPQKIWRVARQGIQSQFGKIPGGIRHFIAVSKFSEDILRPWLPASARIHPLSNPVTYSEASRPRADVSSGKLLYIGRLSPEKGVVLACEAARIAGVPLTILGDGPLKDVLPAQYPEVDFKGWQPQSEVFREMLQSTALVLPSVCYETQGLVVLESLSAGLPAIVADKCAARDYVDGRNGVTFRSGDVADLSEKIRTMLQDRDKVEEMSKYAHTRYWENPLLPESFIKGTLDIYNLVLQDNKKEAYAVK